MSHTQKSFAIVCDSGCDILPAASAAYGVEFVPFYIHANQGELRDTVDLDKNEFYIQLSSTKGSFSIYNPRPDDYRSCFTSLAEQGFSDIISLHTSSALRGSYQAARHAAGDIEHARIHVIDTKCISAQLALVLAAILEDRDNNCTVEHACEHALDVANAARFMVIPAPAAPLLTTNELPSYKKWILNAKNLQARAMGVRRVYTMNNEGYPQEAYRAHEMHLLAGNIVRAMSLYSHRVGPLVYFEVSAGAPRMLDLLEKPLDTNEFVSHCAGTINTNPSTTRQLGVGAVGVAFVPASLVSPDACSRLVDNAVYAAAAQ